MLNYDKLRITITVDNKNEHIYRAVAQDINLRAEAFSPIHINNYDAGGILYTTPTKEVARIRAARQDLIESLTASLVEVLDLGSNDTIDGYKR